MPSLLQLRSNAAMAASLVGYQRSSPPLSCDFPTVVRAPSKTSFAMVGSAVLVELRFRLPRRSDTDRCVAEERGRGIRHAFISEPM
jgi:hypothetical protein